MLEKKSRKFTKQCFAIISRSQIAHLIEPRPITSVARKVRSPTSLPRLKHAEYKFTFTRQLEGCGYF